MQPEVQTTTRGSLAVSAGALEIANVIQGALEVFWFTFTFYQSWDSLDSQQTKKEKNSESDEFLRKREVEKSATGEFNLMYI